MAGAAAGGGGDKVKFGREGVKLTAPLLLFNADYFINKLGLNS